MFSNIYWLFDSLIINILFINFAQVSYGGGGLYFSYLFLKALYILNILTLCHSYHRNISKFVIYLNFVMLLKLKESLYPYLLIF